MSLSNYSFVFAYCEPWDTHLRTSKHYLAQHFAQQNRVLYVEGPWHLLQLMRYPADLRKQIARWWAGPRQVGENLHAIAVPSLLPFHASSTLLSSLVLNRLNQRVAVPAIRRALDTLGMERPIAWIYFGTIAPELPRLRPKLVVAHVVDEWVALPGVPASYSSVEADLLGRADMTIVTSQTLLASKGVLSPNIHLVRHGADLGMFRQALSKTTRIPDDLVAIPEPRIGYYGALHKLDLDLVTLCAKAHPEWSFVLIGPIDGIQGANVRQLKSYGNIYLLGPRPQSSLPGYLKGFQVAMLPFVVNQLTRAMCPIKVYEILAAGRPIVSVDLPEVRVLEDAVLIARSPVEFVKNLEKALTEQAQTFAFKRSRRVDQSDWKSRIATIEALLQVALE